MEKSVKKNYLYNMSYQLLAIIIPLITTPYLSRILGAAGTGTYSYTVSIATYFVLFGSLGISMYGQREIAYVQNDRKKQSKIFIELVILRFITMLFSLFIFWICFARNGEYSIYYRILMLELLANCFDIGWYFQGLEEFKKITIRNFIVRILSLIAIFTFVKKADDIGIYILIYSLTIFFGNVSLWFHINKYIDFVKIRISEMIVHLKQTIILFIPQIAVQVYTVLDKTMLGSILNDTKEVGYYEQGQKIVRILITIISSVGIVMLPRIANCFALKEDKRIKEYMMKTFSFSFLLGFPMVFGISAIANNFVPLFFGNGYDEVKIIMPILSIIIIFTSISSAIGIQYLLSTRRQKEYTYSVVAGAIINFCLNMMLIRIYKSIGASIATVFAEATVALIQLYFVRKEINFTEVLLKAKNYFIAGVLMFICCYLINFLPIGNLITLLIQLVTGVITYILTLYILKDEFLTSNVDNTMSIIKRKMKNKF